MYPSYLNLSKTELNQRIEKLFRILENCEICPRKCHVNRIKKTTTHPPPEGPAKREGGGRVESQPSAGPLGYCQLGFLPKVSASHPHFGEESPLVGKFGSGTIFFTSCNLSCVYCQNYEISQLRIGEEISFEKLSQMMIDLQERGCHNINLVTPTPQVPQILKSLSIAIDSGLKIPLVYNTSSYDSIEVLKLLDGIIDIYLPDARYSDDKISLKYSNAPKYFEIMKKAIKEMHRQVGDLVLDKDGIAVRGIIVRHLVLPNGLAGSEKNFEFLSKEISKDTFLNIMDQYCPYFKAFQYPELSRRITDEEFQETIKLAKKFGLKRLYIE